MRNVKSMILTEKGEPEVMQMINAFASLVKLKPATAIKQFLSQNLPFEIEKLSQKKPNSRPA